MGSKVTHALLMLQQSVVAIYDVACCRAPALLHADQGQVQSLHNNQLLLSCDAHCCCQPHAQIKTPLCSPSHLPHASSAHLRSGGPR